jgi:DNA repair protein RadC
METYKIPSYVLKIRDMPAEDKPREKMLKFGPKVLSVAELVAVVLNTGTVKEDVMSMSSRIVKDYGERALGSSVSAEILAKDLDIPLHKALQIVACSELGRRFFDKRPSGPQIIRTAKDVFDYLPTMRTFRHNTTFWDIDSFNSFGLQYNTGVQKNGMYHLLFERK